MFHLSALLVVVSLTPQMGSGNSAAVSRPISEFLAAQGTYCLPDGTGGCVEFVPPVANHIGWTTPGASQYCDGPVANFALIDYAGLAEAYLGSQGAVSLGTSFRGSISEYPLADGRAMVHVRLMTRNALMWAVDGCDPANGPLVFGYRAPEVLAGAAPALGSSFLRVTFVNTAPGAPMPDLIQLAFEPLPGQELKTIGFLAQGNGELHAEFGVPEGTPGRMTVVQTGLFQTPFQGAVGDGFPAENIDIHVIGP